MAVAMPTAPWAPLAPKTPSTDIGMPPLGEAWNASAVSSQGPAGFGRGPGVPGPGVPAFFEPAATVRQQRIRALRERCAELQWRLETGALKAESEALETQVVQMQEVFEALQSDFKEMKDRFGQRLDGLHRALEVQQAITSIAEKRVICSEDLVRFHEEQRRFMANRWKSLCLVKDAEMRSLNLQLTAYMTDWQHSGMQKQTDASLSHELQCLEDRHSELRAVHRGMGVQAGSLAARLGEAEAELRALQEAASTAKAAALEATGASWNVGSAEMEVACSELRVELEHLEERKQRRDGKHQGAGSMSWEFFEDPVEQAKRELLNSLNGDADPLRLAGDTEHVPPLPWPHCCIWRDELDVRERQLDKIMAQWDRTNNALHSAQDALAKQRSIHEEMKAKHRSAEASLREEERRRSSWQRHFAELHKAATGLRRCSEADLRQRLAAELLRRSAGILEEQELGDSGEAPSAGDGGGSLLGLSVAFGAGPPEALLVGVRRASPPVAVLRTEVERSATRAALGLLDSPVRDRSLQHSPRSPSRALRAVPKLASVVKGWPSMAGQPMQNRIAAIGRETRRLVELRVQAATAASAHETASAAASELARFGSYSDFSAPTIPSNAAPDDAGDGPLGDVVQDTVGGASIDCAGDTENRAPGAHTTTGYVASDGGIALASAFAGSHAGATTPSADVSAAAVSTAAGAQAVSAIPPATNASAQACAASG
eukprot:CAMPEP_0177453106 /NCGR_PEP_ID=MMETSP0369-20130122/10658_1 /TAXON_ID=447022 ORGANISM="Scrippsiella hangoei-like, Strain SHHI-4" /NCGR_SAMPLE_ID=MMETSP0369 /ASSEMBLY_ACC=CAM_ASM_000364 /LENGTH=716 /DNA_ID=CAMNT_0018925811 /DNA_START=60 /DNA_END=2208 /DNA_ORIENTATION=+